MEIIMANNDIKIVFPEGNISRLSNDKCSCPNEVDVDITNLVVGRKYTVSINNINSTPVRLFPSSFSFTAEETSTRLTYYYQFD
jgi:hypothetical protein